MPRFHFNARTGGVIVPDTEGEVLPSLEAARSKALDDARDVVIETVKFRQPAPDCIQVTDDWGQELMIIALVDILKNP
jgi:hypothetical protein